MLRADCQSMNICDVIQISRLLGIRALRMIGHRWPSTGMECSIGKVAMDCKIFGQDFDEQGKVG
jgi:hypothetical protein